MVARISYHDVVENQVQHEQYIECGHNILRRLLADLVAKCTGMYSDRLPDSAELCLPIKCQIFISFKMNTRFI